MIILFLQFVRHLSDSIRGEYRDRIMVRNAELRMYTIIMTKFMEFQLKVRSKKLSMYRLTNYFL